VSSSTHSEVLESGKWCALREDCILTDIRNVQSHHLHTRCGKGEHGFTCSMPFMCTMLPTLREPRLLSVLLLWRDLPTSKTFGLDRISRIISVRSDKEEADVSIILCSIFEKVEERPELPQASDGH
jgi:hypothetical protein